MEHLIPQMVDAISTRKSRRNFLSDPLQESDEEKVRKFLKILDPPFEHSVEVTLHELPEKTSIFNFKGQNKVHLFASLRAPDQIEEAAKLGFVGELFILYCVSLGIGTCWIGRYKKKNTYQVVYGTPEERGSKKLFCIIPLGYCPEKRSLIEKLSNKVFSSRRKPVEKKLHEDSLKDFPEHIGETLELARWAPSAMNCQCWYFKVSEEQNLVIVEVSKPPGYKYWRWNYSEIDVGTSASHVWLGLKNQGVSFDTSIEEDVERIVWKFIIDK